MFYAVYLTIKKIILHNTNKYIRLKQSKHSIDVLAAFSRMSVLWKMDGRRQRDYFFWALSLVACSFNISEYP